MPETAQEQQVESGPVMDAYRFPRFKDASWNSYDRQKQRYETIRPLLGEHAVGAEIGVYKGGFGEFLLPHCKLLYLVDPWYRLKPFWGSPSEENSSVRAFIEIMRVYTEDIEDGRVQVIPQFATEFLASVPSGQLDWVYLDASHEYATTLAEIHLALNAIKHGGFLIGDDYDPNPSSFQHGVFLAVNEVVSSLGVSLSLCDGRQWAFQVP
jgi:Methyltransferase domain